MSNYIGIDVGGTNIRIGVIDENNNIQYLHKEPTLDNVSNKEELYNKILGLIQNVPCYNECNAIGIGVPGAVKDLSEIKTARNLEFLKEISLHERLSKDLNKMIFIENDAKVAALAEASCGAGKDYNIVCYITISTGLGGGIVADKNIYYGANGVGGYFSRMILDGQNIAENLVSGTAFKNKVNEKIGYTISSVQEGFELAKTNEDISNVVKEFKQNLTNLLLNISITVNPYIIVIGGGVVNAKEYFLDDVKDRFRQEVHSFAKETKIEIASLDEPGVIGAGLLAKKHSKEIKYM